MEILYEELNRGYLGLSYEPYLQGWVLHVNFNPNLWATDIEKYNIIKYCLAIFKIVLKQLKERGITEVYGLCRGEKEAKFNKLFGFRDTHRIALCNEGQARLILKLEF
jgi:hypothetical protein